MKKLLSRFREYLLSIYRQFQVRYIRKAKPVGPGISLYKELLRTRPRVYSRVRGKYIISHLKPFGNFRKIKPFMFNHKPI